MTERTQRPHARYMLKGRSALITGSLDGIGFAIAQALARDGCAIMLNGFGDVALIDARLKSLRDLGADADYHGADLSVPSQIDDLVTTAVRRFGAVDIAVNNAVTRTWGHIDELPVEKWDYALAVNLTAPFHVIRLTMPGMKKRKWGRIINLASNYGIAGTVRRADYVSTKHGLVGLTKVAALEGLPYNITANAICPGATLTPNARKLVGERMAAKGLSEADATTDYLSDRQPRADSSRRRRSARSPPSCAAKTPARSRAHRSPSTAAGWPSPERRSRGHILEQAAISRAAQLFVEARRTGQPMRELPPECKPVNTADVNAIVDAVTAQLTQHDGEVIGGWKIGFVYRPRQRPMVCPLFNSRLFASPARVPVLLTPSLRIEPEISFRLTRDLPARAAPYRAPEVAEAIVACPSLEIIDTRFDTRQRSIRQMIDDPTTRLDAMADHNTTGVYVTGTGRDDWQDFDFAAMRMVMRNRARVIVESIGGHAFVDPFLPCVVLANEMRHRGGMHAGELMVTGSFSGFFEVEPDDPVTAEFVGFGSAEATFTRA